MFPFGFSATTIEFTHSVGFSTFEIICNFFSLSSSILTFSLSPNGIRLGEFITGGTVGSRLIWCSPFSTPISPKTSSYSYNLVLLDLLPSLF